MRLKLAQSAKPQAQDLLSASLVQAPLALALAELGRGEPRRTARAVHSLRALAEAARLTDLARLAAEAERALEGEGDLGQALTLLARHGTALVGATVQQDPETSWAHMMTLFREATRSYAHVVGKVADLKVHASATLYGRDITILAALVLHLMRNAVGHGLEDGPTRAARGKDAAGRLELTLDVVNGVLFGRFADDGGGVDIGSVAAKATAQGLWSAAEPPKTNADLLSLLTAPGFSTARAADIVFGRGVGLEAVRATLAEADGDLRLERTGAFGTAFTFSWVLREPLRQPMLEGETAA